MKAFRITCSSDERDAWLKARASTVGASEVACLLGISKWGSALELWAEKSGKVERQDLSDSEPVFWGNVLEVSIIRGYAQRTRRMAVPFGRMLVSERWPWMSCTPDALVSDTAELSEMLDLRAAIESLDVDREAFEPVIFEAIESGRWWPLQTKNIGFGSADDWRDGVPDYYRAQCAHEGLVCGSRRVTGAALVAGQKLVWDDLSVPEYGADALATRIVELSRAFIARLAIGLAPEADGSESAKRALGGMFPGHAPGKTVALGAVLMERSYDLDKAKEALREAERNVREIENTLKQAIGDAESARFPDGSGYTLKMQTRKETTTPASTFRVLRRKQAKEE